MHDSFLTYRRYRWAVIGALLCICSTVAYLVHEPIGRPNGGTWLGYGLGTIGALLIAWLAWFGIRKRRYKSGGAPLVGWLSAHVYLGLSLVVVATLHTGFQLGANIHTLAWVLTLGVVGSGVYGVLMYRRLPARMSANRQQRTLDQMLATIAGLDREARAAAAPLDVAINEAVQHSTSRTRIGGSAWTQLRGKDPNCPTDDAISRIRTLSLEVRGDARKSVQEVLAILSRKQTVLEAARRDVRYRALLQIWLMAHVPLTVALLAALFAHVFAVLVLR